MSRRIELSIVDPNNNGVLFGPQSRISDFNLSQLFAHEHIEQVVEDFLGTSDKPQVAGFDIVVSGGLNSAATVFAPGRVYDVTGVSFELFEDVELDVEQSDVTLPRIDLVYARLEENVVSPATPRQYVRIRTIAEWQAGAPQYAPTELNQPVERQNRVTVGIRTGAPSSSPVPPALEANEVGLYLVRIGKGSHALSKNEVLDIRNRVVNLRVIATGLATVSADVLGLRKRVESLPDELAVQLGGVYGSVRSLSDVLAELSLRVDRLSLPETLRPKLAPWHADAGKIAASGGLEGSTPIVDIELNSEVAFGSGNWTLNPRRFIDQTRLARFFQISGGAASQKHEQLLRLSDVSEIQADGGGDFVERSAFLTAKRSRTAAAGRGATGGAGGTIEIFGGLAENNSSKLGDWWTYNITNDTVTPRTLTGVAIPNADRPTMFSCGSPTFVLLVAAESGTTTPRWFRVNAETGVVAEHTGTIPTGNWFMGDYIGDGKVFIISVNQISDSTMNKKFWLYDVAAGTFEEIGVSGLVPECRQDHSAGCYFREGDFVLVEFEPGQKESGKTFVFNLQTLTWTRLSISPPYAGTESDLLPISLFRMANINGRPLLVGGLLSNPQDKEQMRVWELTTGSYLLPSEPLLKRPRWSYFDTDVPPVENPALASEVVGESGAPSARGFMIAGRSRYVQATGKIYASVQAGLIETTLNGVQGITLADGSTFASFVVPAYTLPWAVAGYVASLEGELTDAQVKLEVSWDDGVNFHEVAPDRLTTVGDSTTPAVRHIRITLYSFKTSKPVLTRLVELFDQNGAQVEERMVLRFRSHIDAPRYLFIDRQGWLRLETSIAASTPDKALLLKISPNGASSAPTVFSYINKRRGHVKYRGTVSGATQVDYNLAVLPSYVRLTGVVASGRHLYDVADPTVVFNTPTVVSGLVANGDDYILEFAW